MTLFNPRMRASRMTVGTAVVVLQMSSEPTIFGCAEVVANRLCRCTAGGPAIAIKSFGPDRFAPQFTLTHYGQQVKEALEKQICLSAR